MQPITLEKNQVAESLDEATIAALDEAEAAIERSEVVTLEQSGINARTRYKSWHIGHPRHRERKQLGGWG